MRLLWNSNASPTRHGHVNLHTRVAYLEITAMPIIKFVRFILYYILVLANITEF